MKKFEHLFSQDPLGAFDKIEDDYTRYFKIAYKINNQSLDKKRVDLLRTDNNLSKKPYIEVLPEYSPVNGLNTMNELIERFAQYFGSNDDSTLFFQEFIAKGLMTGLMSKYAPYGHQIGMLEKAFAGIDEHGRQLEYKNTVITSGTGSGKTESFLLPLLADIFKEARVDNWAKAQDHKDWHIGEILGSSKKLQYVPNQRKGDSRPAALRGIILYPMNALVEDQMARLREALDSHEVRDFMEKHLNGNRIYFGSYNGATIAPKNYDLLNTHCQDKIREIRIDVAERLQKITDNFKFINDYVNEHPDKKEALYISPRLGGDKIGSEMITRWDMQKWAPDIMITNTSMLSIMLMRKAEQEIFEETNRWLNALDKPEEEREEIKKNRIFHIVVDELHLYRGTAGSEVACLLRMLYNAIGLSPVIEDANGNMIPNPQIKILASSASLGDEKSTQKFLEEFFGIYSTKEGETVFNVQAGSNYTGSDHGMNIDYNVFSAFTHENFIGIEQDGLEADDVEKARALLVGDFIEKNFGCNSLEKFCETYEEQIFHDFHNALPENSDGSKRPISQSELVSKLFSDNLDALRGFLIFRSYIDTKIQKHRLPRFRFHKFFKYVEGLWGRLNPCVQNNEDPISELSYSPKETGSRMVLELLRCENCGELYIGGNRKRNTDGSISLSLNSPNLDQIPNFSPTPMVQNKSYSEYAIFWPHDLNYTIDLGDADHVVEIGSGSFAYKNGQAEWIAGYLDTLTGLFTPKESSISSATGDLHPHIKANCIPGFLYAVKRHKTKNRIIDDLTAASIYATPCTCPYCLQEYTSRKYTHSPIRSFRTGIDRSNQIISKEILYQLDEKAAKLIGFSDSREDAAKQALGIEKEQYRDMVRMLFVECVEENDVDEIIQFVKDAIDQGIDDEEILGNAQQKWVRKDLTKIILATTLAKLKGDDSGLKKFYTKNIPLLDLIGDGSNLDGTLVRKLLTKGINPAGEAHKFQWYEKANSKGLFHWSTAYDFQKYSLLPNADFKDNSYATQIRTELENAVFANSFGKYMGVSVLDAGIGYISGPQSDGVVTSDEYRKLRRLLPQEIDVFEFIDALIRVFGDNYEYPSNENNDFAKDYKQVKSAIKKPIRKICKEHSIDEMELGKAVEEYLKQHCTNTHQLCLELRKLSFTRMTETEYLKCERCGRVHPNKGFGFCTSTSCMNELKDSSKVRTEDLHDHYISFDILKEKKKPRRLHTEELSGQTDNIQARLREFKDLILVENKAYQEGMEKTMPIDMVCVTTTMEVGVDIGSLQAIFQGNMPPTRYNYQQRVGRGGRRGQAFSAAFTFCRGRSHDIYYYEKATDEMVGGIPATPTLSLAPYIDNDGQPKMKLAIMKRVIVKEILRNAFKDLDYIPELQDTAGEFGRVADWANNKVKLEKWITNNSDKINEIAGRYFEQFNKNGSIQEDIEKVIEWIKSQMVSNIDKAIQKTTNLNMGLATYLSESGFMPRYGMPSDSRKFYHGFDCVYKKVKSVDRSCEMSISEFAPGNEKTKDKGKYRIEGLTTSISEESLSGDNIIFYDREADALSDKYIISYSNDIGQPDNNIEKIIDADQDTAAKDLNLLNNQRLVVIPQAYRSLDIKSNTGTPVENNDRGSSFAQVQVFAHDNNQKSENRKEICNVRLSLYEMGLTDDPTVWHINNNNNRFYTGSYKATNLEAPYGGDVSNFLFYDKKINTNGREEIIKKERGRDTLDIALGSKKTTEMVKLELIRHESDNINLSLNNGGNRSAIRAAFFSAAFLLQRALADKLDVQPDEIEICEKIEAGSDYPSIYLSDALPNGAGIVSHLYEDGKLEELIRSIINFDSFDGKKTSKEKSFMQSIISTEHRKNCMTACQKCILTYNNRGYHHVLDWRLGVGILRLMLDPNYDFGFDLTSRKQYEELADLDYIIQECAKKFNLSSDKPGQNYWINDDKCICIYHPLWKREKVQDQITDPHNGIQLYNTFNLLRSNRTSDIGNATTGSYVKGMKRKRTTQQTPTPQPQIKSPTNSVMDDDDPII